MASSLRIRAITRTPSAPASRASYTWIGSTRKSLASTGTDTAAATASNISMDPPNSEGSVSTEIMAAPPAW